MSEPAAVDPEEAFIASLSSCHMLWFLSIAAKGGYIVEKYRDRPTGVMSKGTDGKLAITLVTLHPEATFSDETVPSISELQALHHAAHENCFIAASIKSEVRCEPIINHSN